MIHVGRLVNGNAMSLYDNPYQHQFQDRRDDIDRCQRSDSMCLSGYASPKL